MKTEYEYLLFTEQPALGKTTKWNCQNKRSGTVLGGIHWEGGWRQYCYYPTVAAVYSAGCLLDIANFIKQLMAARSGSVVQ